MTKVLDRTYEEAIEESLVDLLRNDGGYTPAEAIPGLIRSVHTLIDQIPPRDQAQAIDEAFELLDLDGGA